MNSANPGVKPRLLVLASTYPRWPGDPEPGFVHELAKRLIGTFDVVVLGPHAPGAAREEVLDGVRIYRYRYAPSALETLVNEGGIVTNLKRKPWKWLLVPSFVIGLLWSLWRLNQGFRPNVIHAHWLLPQGLAVAALRTLGVALPPLLVTSHGSDLFALRAAPLQALKRFVINRAAAVTVVSSAMREELERIGADTSKVSVQAMGVDLADRFTPDASVGRSRDEILFVGRLVEKKGLRHLIEAMPIILIDHPGASLTVVGFGPEERDLRSRVAALDLSDKVRFVGSVEQTDLPAFYRRAALFVAPFIEVPSGDQEGLGLVAIEAAGCGCPVVVGDVPATRDLPFSRVRSIDTTELASIVSQMLDAARSGSEALRQPSRCLSSFDWLGVAEVYGSLLQAAKTSR